MCDIVFAFFFPHSQKRQRRAHRKGSGFQRTFPQAKGLCATRDMTRRWERGIGRRKAVDVEKCGLSLCVGEALGSIKCFWWGFDVCTCGAGLYSARRVLPSDASSHKALPCNPSTLLRSPAGQRDPEPRSRRSSVHPQWPRLRKPENGPSAGCRRPFAFSTSTSSQPLELWAPLESRPLLLAVVAAPAKETMSLARLLSSLPSPSTHANM